ncbi:MAG: DciA family protein [Acidimicrobiales bacterium]
MTASLPEAARRLGFEGAWELSALAERWAELVGAEVAAHAWPLSLHRGVLVVATDHHAWASQLRVLSAQLLDRVGAVAPGVRSVAVRVSPGGGPQNAPEGRGLVQ